jgi:hypothetical protein
VKKPAWKLIDWTDPKNYEHIEKDPSDEVYAWEFLRRNPQYQNDFAEFVRTGKFLGYTRYILSADGKYTPRHEDMRDWYGLSCESNNYDPKNTMPPIFAKDDYPRFLQKDDLLEFAAATDPDDLLEIAQEEVVVVLSTSHNLDHQISQIKDLLKQEQDKSGAFRRRTELYIKYLRLLDADLMDATEAEILEVLYPDEEKSRSILHTNLKSAQRLRDHNYKRLVSL